MAIYFLNINTPNNSIFVNDNIATKISYLLHPIFLPAYLIIALRVLAPTPFFYNSFTPKSFFAIWGIVFLYTALFPGIMVLWLSKKKIISNLEIENRKERPKIYWLTSGFFLALAYFLYSKGGILTPTAYLILIALINIIGLALISLWIKISAHVSGISSILGIFIALNPTYNDPKFLFTVIVLLILLGFVASARLKLGSHNILQVSTGFIWGFTSGLIGTLLLF
jgi:hypothetical protein